MNLTIKKQNKILFQTTTGGFDGCRYYVLVIFLFIPSFLITHLFRYQMNLSDATATFFIAFMLSVILTILVDLWLNKRNAKEIQVSELSQKPITYEVVAAIMIRGRAEHVHVLISQLDLDFYLKPSEFEEMKRSLTKEKVKFKQQKS